MIEDYPPVRFFQDNHIPRFNRDLLSAPAPKYIHQLFGGESKYKWSPKLRVWDDGIYLSFLPDRYGSRHGVRFANGSAILDDAWVINLRGKEKMFPVLKKKV